MLFMIRLIRARGGLRHSGYCGIGRRCGNYIGGTKTGVGIVFRRRNEMKVMLYRKDEPIECDEVWVAQ
jgi:hypothetical protein